MYRQVHIMTAIEKMRSELNTKLDSMDKRITIIDDRQGDLERQNERLLTQLQDVDDRIDELEGRSRRNNLIFHNIAEKPEGVETWEECEEAVRGVIQTELHQDSGTISIERAHRITRRGRDQPRPIIVGFCLYKEKSAVLESAKKKAKENREAGDGGNAQARHGVYIAEDFTRRVRECRKKLVPMMVERREAGDVSYLRFDKLVVRDRESGRLKLHTRQQRAAGTLIFKHKQKIIFRFLLGIVMGYKDICIKKL